MADDVDAPRMARTSSWSLWRVFAASKIYLALSVFTGVLAGAGSALLLAFITRSLENSRTDDADRGPTFFALCLISMALSASSLILLSRIAQDNLYELRLWLSNCILVAPLRLIQTLGQHRLIAALTADIESIVVAQEALPVLFIEGSKVVAVFIYLWLLSPNLFLIVAAYVVISVIGLQAPQQWALRWLERTRRTENSLFGHFRAATEGVKELKVDARRRQAFLDDGLRETARTLRGQKTRAQMIFILLDRWAETLFYILIGLVLFVAPQFHAATSETLTGFALAILFLGGPLSFVGGCLPNLAKGVVALRNIENMGLQLADASEVGTELPRAFQRPQPGVLEIVDATHQYKNERGEAGYLFGPVTVSIAPGQLVFVIGGNGCGKTTLAFLILGLFVPMGGEIRLAGEAVTNENWETYRQNFSTVFADAFIFDSLFGFTGADEQARAEELLALLKLDNKLSIAAGRFSTIDLSRGERKRLALLAAYMEDRPFYLFDEWAAEQDPEFREIFYQKLLPDLKARGKTVIVISHDDRYFHLADQLIRLRSGKLDAVYESEKTRRSEFTQRLELS